VDSTSILFWKY